MGVLFSYFLICWRRLGMPNIWIIRLVDSLIWQLNRWDFFVINLRSEGESNFTSGRLLNLDISRTFLIRNVFLFKDSELLVFFHFFNGWGNEGGFLVVFVIDVWFLHVMFLIFHFLSKLFDLIFLLSNFFFILLPLGWRWDWWVWGIVPLSRSLSTRRIGFSDFINHGLVS